MNTNNLKRFAQSARRKLLEQVSAKLEYVFTHEASKLKDKVGTLKRLKDELESIGRDTLVEKVAYTWFNRLVALRFMDANGFQPMGIQVLTPVSGISPQILDEAHAGHIPGELPVRKEEVMDILDGKAPSINPDNDAYRILLVASCNQLSSVFPFLFERINDYTELLLPDDLTSPFSIIKDILNGMSDEDCKEVEIIGWLYQFYISERKDEVFASKEKVKKEDIPAATQLFTPRWIVEYMVQNTLGKLWLQNRPNSKLTEFMPYYIESASVTPSGEMSEGQSGDYIQVNSVEEITLLDQASGSGHILVYAFELFSKIYEEEGYTSSEIPQLIIEKNLYGFEIDERAAQLAGFALMMKARSYHRRFFKKEVKPNIMCFKDLRIDENEIKPLFKDLGISISDELWHDLKTMKQATNFGSLIQPHTDTRTLEEIRTNLQTKLQNADIFLKPKVENLIQTLDQLVLLSKKYHCVVDNPPYMGGGNMNKELADFVKTNYPKSKADLMACFMEAGLETLLPKGFLGMINQHSWMFLSSYEALRKDLVENTFFDTLLHLGPRTFPEIGGEVVQNASFTFWNKTIDEKGVFIRLVDFDRSELKRDKTFEAIKDSNCDWFYTANQKDFEKIPGSPLGYWVKDNVFKIFSNLPILENIISIRQGLRTGNNERFLFSWFEIDYNFIGFNFETEEEYLVSERKFVPHHKGGSFRKWFGNNEIVLKFNSEIIPVLKTLGNKLPSREFYFKNSITWTGITGNKLSFRSNGPGYTFDGTGSCAFGDDSLLCYCCGLLQSKVGEFFLKILSPTISLEVGHLKKFPFSYKNSEIVRDLTLASIEIEKFDWDSSETSWDFDQNELLKHKTLFLEDSFELFSHYWTNKFFQLHRNEEDVNNQFIKIYGLQEELTLDVPLEEITILQDELDRDPLKNENSRLKRDPETGLVIDYSSMKLKFNEQEIFTQFVSYSVGCVFGRYSLDQEGLILANQGETLEDYFRKIEKSADQVSFLPDADNIIPILDDEWFEDDIVSRFHEFLKASFGEQNFRKNLAFVEECLGKDLRKYFVKDFYKDHIQRYKKRPIYWSFSSPKGYFNVLIYMHRYTPDTLNRILNNYLREFIEKLQAHRKNLLHIEVSGTPVEQNKARKDINKLDEMIADCRQYETDILYPLATERISIDLDEGVLVNYNKFGKAITEVAGLNDKKAKDKVKKFDWIDTSTIR